MRIVKRRLVQGLATAEKQMFIAAKNENREVSRRNIIKNEIGCLCKKTLEKNKNGFLFKAESVTI